MPDQTIPQTPLDYVRHRLAKLPPVARLAVVFDPDAVLLLKNPLPDSEEGTRRWRVLRYEGNDLAFLRERSQIAADVSLLVHVTGGVGGRQGDSPRIELRSLMEVWLRADEFIDGSLAGILRSFAASEVWPRKPLMELAPLLSRNLPAVIGALRPLRLQIGRHTALDERTVRAITLHALQPSVPVDQLLFRQDTAARVLNAYLQLLWSGKWPPEALHLLREQVRSAPVAGLGDQSSWLNLPIETLALYIYLRRILSLYQIPNIANQLRGLGVLPDVQTDQLEAFTDSLIQRWERERGWRAAVIGQAESQMAGEAQLLPRLLGLFELSTWEQTLDAVVRAETPALLYTLLVRWLEQASNAKAVGSALAAWAARRPAAIDSAAETPYSSRVRALASCLDELAFIEQRIGSTPPESRELTQLLEWYIENQLYDLEYASARAWGHLLPLENETVAGTLKRYLEGQRKRLRDTLHNHDKLLAQEIMGGWNRYLSHPRLATKLVSDALKGRGRATADARVWVIVFDGMRWDTWARHVRPRLLEHFEYVAGEQPYLSLLPSWTLVARSGLLAGALPGDWSRVVRRFPPDQRRLAANLFRLTGTDADEKLQFYSGMESDTRYDQVSEARAVPYNVLIYNISDDNLHGQRSDLVALNKTINVLLDQIIQMLQNLIGPRDIVVISSDHGFVERDEQGAVEVAHRDPNSIRYRYVPNTDVPPSLTDVYKVIYPGFDQKFTVTVGRRWLQRPGPSGPEDRYAHGGISFAEMVVPGAVLRRINVPKIEPSITVQPEELELIEEATGTITVQVANKGNRPFSGELTIKGDTEPEGLVYTIDLAPGDAPRQIGYSFRAVYRERSGQVAETTRLVQAVLNWTGLDGSPKNAKVTVSVRVNRRSDKVELDFGGLSDLDI